MKEIVQNLRIGAEAEIPFVRGSRQDDLRRIQDLARSLEGSSARGGLRIAIEIERVARGLKGPTGGNQNG